MRITAVVLALLLLPAAAAYYETGSATLATGWNTIQLNAPYSDPVVVAFRKDGGENGMNTEVSVVLVTNVTTDSFQAKIVNETDSLAGDISYLAADTGTQTLDNGIVLQAGREPITAYDGDGSDPAAEVAVSFPQSYAQAPVVLAGPQNSTADDWLSPRYQTGSLSASGVTLSLERDEAAGTAPIPTSDEIGWVSINSTSTPPSRRPRHWVS